MALSPVFRTPKSSINAPITIHRPATEPSGLTDPAIGINWQLEGEPLLSDKDADAGFLSDLDNPFIFESISRNFW
jgi:hypothetical protein